MSAWTATGFGSGSSANKGVAQDHTIADKLIADHCRNVASDTKVFSVSGAAVRKHWKSVGGDKVHDIRSAVATMIAARLVRDEQPAKTQREFAKLQKRVATVVAQTLGNNPSESLATYINHDVFKQVRP